MTALRDRIAEYLLEFNGATDDGADAILAMVAERMASDAAVEAAAWYLPTSAPKHTIKAALAAAAAIGGRT